MTGWLTLPEMRLAILVPLVSAGAMALALCLSSPPWLHTVGLFVHLASLVVGLGAVMAVDWSGLMFLLRRSSFHTVLIQAHRTTPLIWLGLLGLLVSGTVLEPRLTPLTVVKFVAVLCVGLVGVLVTATTRRMMPELPTPSRALLRRGMILAALSQVCWWTAAIIGFVNAQR